MVEQILSLSRNGIKDWLLQRATALVIAAYFVFILGYFATHTGVTYLEWKGLFSHLCVRLFSFFTLVSVLWHAWIGMWTVLTDYVKCAVLRLSLELILIGTLFIGLIWGVSVVWGL